MLMYTFAYKQTQKKQKKTDQANIYSGIVFDKMYRRLIESVHIVGHKTFS